MRKYYYYLRCFLFVLQDPLNSGDDVSEEDPTEIFDTENVVVCQYDKVGGQLCRARLTHLLLTFMALVLFLC